MKELSIEAKAYDEAIKRLRNAFYDNNSRMCIEYRNAVLKIIEPIFPELKESEDEWIKNEIIAFVEQSIHRGGGTPIPEEQEAKWLSWLEKQSKDSPVLSNSSNTGVSSWSEEDENISSAIIKRLKGSDALSVDLQRAICWIDHVKDRVLPQPNQEWSEEDENRMKKVMHILSLDGRINNAELVSIYDWLKSLRPQNTWKPSAGQLEALKQACDEHWEPDGLDPLYTLYQDLKKLREE